MIDWKTVLAAVLTSSSITALVIAGFVFIAKTIFTSTVNKIYDRYKADLQKSTFEHQTLYQSLHVKRSEVIAQLYSLLVQAEKDATALANPAELTGGLSRDETWKQARKSSKELRDFFEVNRIYFKAKSCEKIDNFIQELYIAVSNFQVVLAQLADSHSNLISSLDRWQEAWEKLKKELPPLKVAIEQEFRGILGL